jgi:hypothetical protein
MNVLVFSPNMEKLGILAFCIESQLRLVARQASSFSQALEYLLADSPVDMIVADECDQWPILCKYLLSINAQIPLILLGKSASAFSEGALANLNLVACLDNGDPCAGLVELLEKKEARWAADDLSSKYCRINVDLLLRLSPLASDVYVRLSSLKYVKIFNAGAGFTENDLDRIYGIKKIDFLYVARDAAQPFLARLGGALKQMSDAAREGEEGLLERAVGVQETLHGLALKVGFTQEMMSFAKTHVDFALKAIGASPRMSKALLPALLKKDASIANESMVVAHVACCIAGKLDWPSHSTFHKLIYAALLHDIALASKPTVAIKTRADLIEAKKALSPAEAAALEHHMFLASDIANKFTEIPSDVQLIVVQHHERPDGSGFPRGMSTAAIAPLAAVFIVAREIVEEYEAKGAYFSHEEFWRSRAELYTMGTFKKIAHAFADAPTAKAA